MQTEPLKDEGAEPKAETALANRNGETGVSVPTEQAAKPGPTARTAPRRDSYGKSRAVTADKRLPTWALVGAGVLIGILFSLLALTIRRHRAAAADLVVAVNGKKISKEALFHRMEVQVGIPAMHKMVEEQMQLQFAKKKGLAPTDAEVEKEYAKVSTKPGFEQALISSGQTGDDVKLSIRIQLAKVAVLTQGVSVTDTDVRRYYDVQSDSHTPNALFYRPPVIQLQVIETRSRTDADKALAELNASTPFELVVATYSQDASKSNGGLLNALIYGRSPLHRAPDVENAVFGLKVGGQMGPIAFNNGWWIFHCVNKTAAAKEAFADVRDQCLSGAKVAKAVPLNGKKVEAEFAEFQRHSNLQAFWPQYQAAIRTK